MPFTWRTPLAASNSLLIRLSGWPRRLLAATFLGLAAVSAVSAHHDSASGQVLVARKPIAAGASIAADDVTLARWPTSVRPAASLASVDSVVGRRASSPIAAGEAVTTTRLVDDSMIKGLTGGLSAVSVTVAGTAALIHGGDFVDVISPAGPTSTQAEVLADRVLVLAVLPGARRDVGEPTVELIVAVDRVVELRLSATLGGQVLASLRSPP